ncbi:MAG: recombinase family protein, partial [Pyrobaculum sp.]
MRLVAYIRVSRDDEQPENQEYAIFKWAAERGHQVVEVVRDVGVSGALPPGERPGWQKVVQLLEQTDG